MDKEKKTKQAKKRTKTRTINMWLYRTYIPVLIFLARIIFGLKTDKSRIKKLDGPFLVLGNHTSPVDFLFFCGCVYPKPLNFVVASNMYYTGVYGWYLKRYNTISKKQFSADLGCIKNIKRNLDNGTSVLLFPEGRVTVDGTTGYISPTIGKLVKWLGYPVVSGITEGGYVSNPKWGRHKRSTQVKLSLDMILSKEDIAKMSAKEISNYIIGKLQYNDNQQLIDKGGYIPGVRLAEGLDKILYKCPKCGAEFRNTSQYMEMKCTACGNTIRYCNDGRIAPVGDSVAYPLISDWYKFQRDTLKEEVKNPDYTLSDKVVFQLNNRELGKFAEVGRGIITVNKENIIYEGTVNNEIKRLEFKIQNHASLAFVMGRNIEISEEENIFRFEFIDGLYSTKYVMAIEEIYKLYYDKAE